MTTERSELGLEIETALGEVLGHVRGETALSCRIVDDPAAGRIVALRKRLRLSRQKFADRFGLDVRALQEWEQGRRIPDRAARVLLTVIDRDPRPWSGRSARTAQTNGWAVPRCRERRVTCCRRSSRRNDAGRRRLRDLARAAGASRRVEGGSEETER